MTLAGAIVGGAVIDKIAGMVVDKLAGGALDRLMRGRMERARQHLQQQMAAGRVWAWTEDDTAAALFTYFRAAQEGTARMNLRMMAEAMCTGAQEPTFQPDAFRRHSLSLSSLSRDEIMALVGLMKAEAAVAADGAGGDPGRTLIQAPEQFGMRPGIVLDGSLQALGRTGWVVTTSLYSATGYVLTSNFDEVRRLVDFEVALRDADGAEQA